MKDCSKSGKVIVNENFMNFAEFHGNFSEFHRTKTLRLSAVLSMRPSSFNSIIRILQMVSMPSSHLRAAPWNSHLKLDLTIYRNTKMQKLLRISAILEKMTFIS